MLDSKTTGRILSNRKQRDNSTHILSQYPVSFLTVCLCVERARACLWLLAHLCYYVEKKESGVYAIAGPGI